MITLNQPVLEKKNLANATLKSLGEENRASNPKYADVKTVFTEQAKKISATDSEKQNLLAKLVSVFKKYVLSNFIEKYRPGYKADGAQVQTLTADAFKKLDTSLDDKIAESKDHIDAIRDILRKSYLGKDNRQEYFDWLDFSERGTIRTSVNEAKEAALLIRSKCDNALVMGMGGSSMCSKLLNSAFDSGDERGMKISTMDNMDPATLKTKLKDTNDKTAFVIISKSGGTFEAAHVIQGIINHLREKNNGDLAQAQKEFAQRAVFITEPSEYEYHTQEGKKKGSNQGMVNKLISELEEKTGTKPIMIKHPPRVGGRNALFSPVGMLTSEMKSLNTDEFLAGADQCIREFVEGDYKKSSALQYALLDTTAALSDDFSARYVMPYTDRLSLVPEFSSQLAGESNNKNGVSSLNQISGRGPTAHHSDVEALCRNDKRRILFEEIIVKDTPDDKVHMNTGLDSLKDYQLKSMHQDAVTKLALPFGRHLSERKDNPVITTVLDKLDERNLGYLMMRNMLATAIQGGINGVRPEEGLDKSVRQAEVEAFKVAKKTDANELGLANTELALAN